MRRFRDLDPILEVFLCIGPKMNGLIPLFVLYEIFICLCLILLYFLTLNTKHATPEIGVFRGKRVCGTILVVKYSYFMAYGVSRPENLILLLIEYVLLVFTLLSFSFQALSISVVPALVFYAFRPSLR